MNAMTIHLAASIPNFQILETIAVDVPWRREIVREDLVFTAGEIVVPNFFDLKPGQKEMGKPPMATPPSIASAK